MAHRHRARRTCGWDPAVDPTHHVLGLQQSEMSGCKCKCVTHLSNVEASISTSIPQMVPAESQTMPLEHGLAAPNCGEFTSCRYEWICFDFSHLVAVRLSISTKLGKTETKILTHPLGLAGVPDVDRVNPESLAVVSTPQSPPSIERWGEGETTQIRALHFTDNNVFGRRTWLSKG